MSIAQKKAKVFGNIAAAQTLVSNLPKLKKKNSFPSVNNKGDAIAFLTDIIISLIGTVALIGAIVDILTKSLGKIEKDIKKALKIELKSIVSCGINPSLPDFMKPTTGSGIVIRVRKVDFVNLFKVDANTTVGKLLYNDVTPLLVDSTDFNTFLSGVIKKDGQEQTWRNIFKITFNSIGNSTRPNNTFTIKTHPDYATKTLNDLNNDFIDSLTLFNVENIVVRIIEIIFGSISFSISKTRKQLEEEEKINKIIDKMVDEDINTKDNDTQGDDGFFSFTNEDMVVIERRSSERQRGVIKIKTSEDVNSSVPVSSLTSFTESMSIAQTDKQKKDALTNGLNGMANDSSSKVGNAGDKYTVKLNFFLSIIKNLIKVIVGIILSPKIVMIFLINYKIVYGPTAEYKDAVDFIRKNKKLFKQIIKRIAGMIIKILLAIAMRRITKLIEDATKEKLKEKIASKKAQLLSLVGVPQEALRKIKGLM